jgi:hypothetical protein
MEPAGTRRGACEIIKTEKARSAFELWPLSLQQSFLRLPLSHGRALRMFPAIPDQAEHRDQPCETRPHRRPPVARRPQEQCADRFLPELSRSALQVARSESPFRVNRVGLTACRRLPLCPRQRKSSGRPSRSVSCTIADVLVQAAHTVRWMDRSSLRHSGHPHALDKELAALERGRIDVPHVTF